MENVMTPHSLQLLEQLLTGYQMTPEELDDLVKNGVREDLYLEYKDGREVSNKDSSNTIREYISGFANSAGGILIVGVDAPDSIPKEVTGCKNHTKGKLDDWASRCLTPIAHHFSPLPRFHTVAHEKGEVLIGVVQRSLGLVPVTTKGSTVYHFRLHDQTLKAPDYLMSDLLLGRRQHPSLEITDCKATSLHRRFIDNQVIMDLDTELIIKFENTSIVWAEEVDWGVIAWVQKFFLNPKIESVELNRHLLSFVDKQELDPNKYSRNRLTMHIRGIAKITKPFTVDQGLIRFRIPLQSTDNRFRYIWKAALYLITRNSPPIDAIK